MDRFITGIVIAMIAISLDQYSKYFIFDFLTQKETHMLAITPFFNLVMVRNYGVSFGMFDGLTYGYLILSGIALSITVVLLIWMYKAQSFYYSTALGLIIGGAIGNIIDRMLYGSVADFLDFYIGNYHWPAFNIADSTVFIGVVMLLFENIFTNKRGNNEQKN